MLEVLNEKEITSSTKKIELRIIAEQGFDPQKEVDVQSLRFGSYQEVNYGGGSKPVRTRKDGKDLIVVFNGFVLKTLGYPFHRQQNWKSGLTGFHWGGRLSHR